MTDRGERQIASQTHVWFAAPVTINLKVNTEALVDERRRDHSPLTVTPPLGVDRQTWDAQRLAQSLYPLLPQRHYL